MPGTAAAHNEPREIDPFKDAMTDEPRLFHGQLDVNAWTCVLVKGQGKVPYDPQAHQGQRTSTAIEFTVSPVDATQKLIQREMLNWTADFKGVCRPSVEALAEKIAKIKSLTVGQFNPLKEINEMWVKGEFVPRPDNKEGETWTTLKFLDVYPDEPACKNAAGVEDDGVTPGFETPAQSPAVDPDRAAMAAFLPGLWEASGHEYAKFLESIASNPMTAKHFNETSPEVKKFEAPF